MRTCCGSPATVPDRYCGPSAEGTERCTARGCTSAPTDATSFNGSSGSFDGYRIGERDQGSPWRRASATTLWLPAGSLLGWAIWKPLSPGGLASRSQPQLSLIYRV